MENTLYAIIRNDEGDNTYSPLFYTNTEADAIKAVSELNKAEGLSIVLEDDGSVADIVDDDAIWYSYHAITPYQK